MHSKILNKLHHSVGAKSNIWELYHENSKVGKYDIFAPREFVLGGMERYAEALNYESLPEIELPEPEFFDVSLAQAIIKRESVRDFDPSPISFRAAAAVLHYSYGINRDNKETDYPRPFRNVPSGGGLFPLDIYFHNRSISDLKSGLYHYNPTTNSLRFLKKGDQTAHLTRILVQPELGEASMILFISAQFERALFKYQDRGYRFILLDAGHVAQNMNLVATALGLGSVNIGGYFDRLADAFLGVDGLTQSTIYMVAVGNKAEKKKGEEKRGQTKRQ